MSITVRQATPDDAELMALLNQPIQQQHADALPHIFKPACMNDVLIEHYRGVLSSAENVAYVVEVDGVPAGYMVCVIQIKPENSFVYAQRLLVIDQISVNPEFQRRGIGRQLMDTAVSLAKEQQLTRIMLNVWSFNLDAVQFYREQRFEPFKSGMHLLTGL